MSPIVAGGLYGYYAVAANETLTPAQIVIVGDVGLILYSTRVEEDENGLEAYVFSQATRFTYFRLSGVDFGNGVYVLCGGNGVLATSGDGAGWTRQTSGTVQALNDVCHVSGSIWVTVGASGTILRSTDNGITWAAVTSNTGANLNAVAVEGTDLVAVGDGGAVVVSADSGATWAAATSTSTQNLQAVTWWGDGSVWVIVGNGTTILNYDGAVPGVFDTGSAFGNEEEIDLEGVAWAGAGGLLIASGSGAATITSSNGISWTAQESGATSSFLHAVEYLDSRFIAVGADQKICYSSTGAGVRSFDKFKPISDIYRSVAFARFGGTMLYLGMLEFEDGEWVYYPRRIRNPAPGTVNDFDEAFGAYFSDLPGDGAIIAAASVEGGIVVGEQNQIALLTDGGSVITPWAYHDNYGEGLQLISNLTTFGGAAFGICTDGLIYRADYNSVARLQSFFDLTKFDDFNPGSERVSIQFDPATQKLVVFRPASPWSIFLCDDETGGFTEFHLPEFVAEGVTYTPSSVFVAQGEISGLKVGYSTDDEDMSHIVTLELQIDASISGFDVASQIVGIEPFAGEVVTGCFRITQLGVRGELSEILVRTNCDPDSTVRPVLAVGVKSEPEDEWRYSPAIAGTIEVDGHAGLAVGTKTAFTNRIVETGDATTTDFEIPWLVEKVTRVFIKHKVSEAITDVTYTKIGAREIQLAAAVPVTHELHVHGVGLPYVRGRAGDLLELDDGRLLVIEEALDPLALELEFWPEDYDGEATYIPTQDFPEGDSYGDGKLTFGLGQGFDQIMLRFIMVARSGCDAKFAKIKKIELGYTSTGKELKTDE